MTDLKAPFAPNWISPPGDTIADVLEERGWTQAEFARRLGYTEKHVIHLINGEAPITEDTASRLVRVLGGTPGFWLRKEAIYRKRLRRQQLAQQSAAHPAITHCDNCGCDWLDNGLNPIGCPYCEQFAQVAEIKALRAELEIERLKLAAIGAVAHGSEQRLDQDSPYRSDAYDTVCRLAEMAHDELAKDAARYRWLRDPCSGAERVIFYCRGDYGMGLMSSAMLDAAIDDAMQHTTGSEK